LRPFALFGRHGFARNSFDSSPLDSGIRMGEALPTDKKPLFRLVLRAAFIQQT
jgi:hypothetical protein